MPGNEAGLPATKKGRLGMVRVGGCRVARVVRERGGGDEKKERQRQRRRIQSEKEPPTRRARPTVSREVVRERGATDRG